MKMRGLGHYILFDLSTFWREPMAIIFTFVLPAVFFIGAASGGGLDEKAFTHAYAPSFLAIIVITTALFTVGPTLVLGRELGFYKRLLATPMDTSVVLVSSVVRSFLVVLGGMIEILLLSYLLLGTMPKFNLVQFLLAVLLASTSIFVGGVLLGSIFKSTRTAFSVSVILLQPLLFMSGATMPISQLPEGPRTATLFLPSRHMVDLLRLGWRGELFTPSATMPALFLLIFMMVCGALARSLFRWTSR
jgi:ABC-2 type transport system permease protein